MQLSYYFEVGRYNLIKRGRRKGCLGHGIFGIKVVAAKEVLSVEEYYRVENQSEERIQKVRIPAKKFARELLK